MIRHAITFLFLLASAAALSSCHAVRVEHVSHEFKKAGLRGKTVALGEVLSARPAHDPTPSETAATLVACETWLKERRPSTRVVSFVSLGRQVGELKTRFQGGAGVPLAAMTPAQYRKALAAGVDFVLFVEVLEKDFSSGTRVCEKEERTTEYDSEGKAQDKTSTTEYYVSFASCWVECRYYLVDVRTRQVVWQVSGTGSASESKEGGQVGIGTMSLPAIPAMPATTEAIRSFVPSALRKLPK